MFHIFKKVKTIMAMVFIVALTAFQVLLVAPGFAADIGRYQVIAGNDDNAYLVDTTTGFVWILSHRALPTGREPIAIPYKFIGFTPQNQKNFLVENAPALPDSVKGSK